MVNMDIKKRINFYLRKKLQFFVKRASFFFSNSPTYSGGIELDKKLVVGAKRGSKVLSSLSTSRFLKKSLYYTGKGNFSRFFSILSSGFFELDSGGKNSISSVELERNKNLKLDSFFY